MMRCLLSFLFVLSACSLRADEAQQAKDAKIVQTVLRLPGFDLNSKPAAKEAVLRYLQTIEGDEKYVEIVEKFSLAEAEPGLLKQAITKSDTNVGVGCARLLLKFGKTEGLLAAIRGKDAVAAAGAITALGLTADPLVVPLLDPLLDDAAISASVRVAAVIAIGKTPQGEKVLLERTTSSRLPAEFKFAAANVLLNSSDEKTRTEAGKFLTLPATADSKPLPSLAQLVKSTGNATAGKTVFDTKGTCIKCHAVNGQGKDVGPNLSEIGGKLSREAMYVSILDPSAGISHNFETHTIVLESGQQVTGIIVSDTADAVTVKTADAIQRAVPRDEIEEIVKLKTSLMPADLQRQLTAQDLIDVVEYLTTLKKP